MNKEQTDQLYHQLRAICADGNVAEKAAIGGLASHLTSPNGDYRGLLIFLTYYGERFLTAKISEVIKSAELEFDRIVDLGCGFGWLGRMLAINLGDPPTLFIDKRQWVLVDVVADIESKNGILRVMDELHPKDLIVMGELLHCLRDPEKVLKPIMSRWPCVIVEYSPDEGSEYADSYNRQIATFGCKSVNMVEFLDAVGVTYTVVDTPPHIIVVTRPG